MQSEINNIEPLFLKHHAMLCNIANNIVNDRDNAKDIVQDVFIGLWQNRNTVNWNTSLKGYLIKSTANRSINWLEKNSRNISFENSGIEPSENVVDQTMGANELQEKVKASIEKLPPKCKAIFVLSRSEGMKYRQIAEHLDISVKTVENQMSIALERLRNDLKSQFLIGISLFFTLSLLLFD